MKQCSTLIQKTYSYNREKTNNQCIFVYTLVREYPFMQVLIRYLCISKMRPIIPECGPLSRTAGECQPRRIREYCVIKGL